jgi:hypothetical protein
MFEQAADVGVVHAARGGMLLKRAAELGIIEDGIEQGAQGGVDHTVLAGEQVAEQAFDIEGRLGQEVGGLDFVTGTLRARR